MSSVSEDGTRPVYLSGISETRASMGTLQTLNADLRYVRRGGIVDYFALGRNITKTQENSDSILHMETKSSDSLSFYITSPAGGRLVR